MENVAIAVIYPVVDTRGPFADRLRTWTSGQTLDRERYRVIATFGAGSPESRREAARLLSWQDRIVEAPECSDCHLWNEGATHAAATWLVFTEGHCLARPECLAAVARWTEVSPAAEAANFAIDHSDDYLMARLSRQWFDMVLARWTSTDSWERLHRTGFVIRADIFRALGGFEARYEQFAPQLLSAKLHERGFRIATVPGAAVLHLDDETVADHHFDTASYVTGECEARSSHDRRVFERYFGEDPWFMNRLVEHRPTALHLMQAAAGALVLSPRSWRSFALAMAGPASRVCIPPSLRTVIGNGRGRLDEICIQHLPMPWSLRLKWFVRAHARTVERARSGWLSRQDVSGAAPPDWTQLRAMDFSPTTIVGAYGLEQQGGEYFCWTHPVFLLRLPASAQERTLMIDTGGHRPEPEKCIVYAMLNGRRELGVKPRGDGRGIMIRLPASSLRCTDELTFACSELVPCRTGSSDRRRLGLPILSLGLSENVVPSGSAQECVVD